MTFRSRSPQDFALPRWIRPFHRCWKPLIWIWGALFLGVFINISSSWLLARRFDPTGTPLGWLASHLWITLPPLLLLLLLTLLAGFASLQEHAASPASPLTLTPKQHLQFIRGFQQEYSSRLASSLQGQATLELHLQERTDVIASSASLVFHHLETGEVSPLPLGTSIIQAYDRASRGLLLGVLVFGPLGWLLGGLLGALGGGVCGVLLFGGRDYFQHYLLRLLLSQSHALPWRAVPFLEEARGCILLQRVGGGYRFIHPLLQEYFASLAFSLTIEK